uniref:Uncharacterized protein n=1 Tax=Anopheles culicifacies TaxID=139723 RepID=A0A182MRG9_9DIPT
MKSTLNFSHFNSAFISLEIKFDGQFAVKFRNDCELEEIVSPPKYRPESIAALCEATRFTEAEIKRIYRGFKAECPAGIIREETFKFIYSQFFPQGEPTHEGFGLDSEDRCQIGYGSVR